MIGRKIIKHQRYIQLKKPVLLIEKLIKIFTNEGDVVIDPVAGSGTTLLAAQNTGRKGYGFEIKKGFHMDATKALRQNAKRISDIKVRV